MWTPVDTFDDGTTVEETEVAEIAGGALVKVTSTEKCKMGNATALAVTFVPNAKLADFQPKPDEDAPETPVEAPATADEEPTEENTAPDAQDGQ